MSLSIIILAAGKGTRMKSSLPKVLHPIAHKPMINHVVDTAASMSPNKIVIVTNPETESAIKSVVTHKITTCKQPKALGTGDAVKCALPQIKNVPGHVLILFGDTPLITRDTLNDMVAALNQNPSTAVAVLGFHPDDPAEYGRIIIDSLGEIERIVEYNDASDAERAIDLCNSGVMAIRSEHIENLIKKIQSNNVKKEYYLTDIIGLAKQQGLGCTYVEAEPDEVMGINNRIQLAEVEAALQFRLRVQAMEQGVTMQDPDSVMLAADTQFGQDVTLQPSIYFGPEVTVENNVKIKAFSHIEGATIKEGSSVGPFARIRPGSEIGVDAHIGNFVEVKNTTLKTGAKAGHLSYLGDATIGEDANIGAGTITCNYDGKNKHHTIIGDKAFIGSNTALVAPVTIGDGALIGAGSVITEDVDKDKLALARARQVQK